MKLRIACMITLALLPIAACGNQAPQQGSAAGVRAASSATAEQPDFSLGPGVEGVLDTGGRTINTINVMAPDPSSGVWAWVAGKDRSELVRVTQAGAVQRLSMPKEFASSIIPPNGLAACSTGVWAGVGRSLVHFDGSGRAVAFTLPETKPIAAIDAHRPSELQGLSQVSAVGCINKGVVVGLTNASDAFTVDSAGVATALRLPESYQVSSLAATKDGSVLMAVQKPGKNGSRLLSVDSVGRVGDTEVTIDGSQVVTDGQRFFAGREVLDRNGETVSVASPLGDENPMMTPAITPAGVVVKPTSNGLEARAADGRVSTLRLGEQRPCFFAAPARLPDMGGPTSTAEDKAGQEVASCPLVASALAAAQDGSVFVALASISDLRIVRVVPFT